METTTEARGGISSTLVLALVAVLVAIAALALAVLGGGDDSGGGDGRMAADLVSAIDKSAYQAVTLTSGTVYFGKLSNEGAALLLDDVYYLAGATQENPSGSLVKRGAEIAAPEGSMVLNPALVVQIDQIGADSVILRGIKRIASGDTATTTSTTAKPTTTTTVAEPTTTAAP